MSKRFLVPVHELRLLVAQIEVEAEDEDQAIDFAYNVLRNTPEQLEWIISDDAVEPAHIADDPVEID